MVIGHAASREWGIDAVKIYTKTGDDGTTGLFGGARVPKDDARVIAYGTVDELNAAIGVARASEPAAFADELLEAVQRDLFTLGAELAAPDAARAARALPGAPIGDDAVGTLERAIDAQEARLTPLKQFVLPGGAPKAAALHVARTVCRRAERQVVALGHATPVSPAMVRYLNRLSDLLFVLARGANAAAGRSDVTW
jgi:cob(I)alamin adenosyltransferase